jgi:hypothetical protein
MHLKTCACRRPLSRRLSPPRGSRCRSRPRPRASDGAGFRRVWHHLGCDVDFHSAPIFPQSAMRTCVSHIGLPSAPVLIDRNKLELSTYGKICAIGAQMESGKHRPRATEYCLNERQLGILCMFACIENGARCSRQPASFRHGGRRPRRRLRRPSTLRVASGPMFRSALQRGWCVIIPASG